tara:strand:- start:1376 stop:1708 length:333 start_codon:yes stop_codon:yes gene_type:complete
MIASTVTRAHDIDDLVSLRAAWESWKGHGDPQTICDLETLASWLEAQKDHLTVAYDHIKSGFDAVEYIFEPEGMLCGLVMGLDPDEVQEFINRLEEEIDFLDGQIAEIRG